MKILKVKCAKKILDNLSYIDITGLILIAKSYVYTTCDDSIETSETTIKNY